MKKIYKLTILLAALVIAVRLALPYFVLRYINNQLSSITDFYGHAETVDLHLYRAAYVVKGLYLNKVDPRTKTQHLFFETRKLEMAMEWKALFHASVVGSVVLTSPEIIFTKDKVNLTDVKQAFINYRPLFDILMPLRVNRLEVNDGTIKYTDNTSKPEVDVSLKKTYILGENLLNIIGKDKELPSTLKAQAEAYEGTLELNMRLNNLAKNPTFEMNAELKNTNLTLLNNFIKAYGGFEVQSGNFSLYSEMAARDGKFIGYVKPLITSLHVLGPKKTNDTFFQKIWKLIVAGTADILKNQKEDQLGTKIRLDGNLNDPKVNTLDAVWEIVKNAFVKALQPRLDNEININSVKPAGKK